MMKYEAEYMNMDEKTLSCKLSELKLLLEEVGEEREFVLGQSGQHIPATRLVKEYKTEIDDIKDRIKAVEYLLKERKVPFGDSPCK